MGVKFLQKLITWLLLPAFLCLSLYGCMLADQGAKEIGGYFEDNRVFEVTLTEEELRFVLFNEIFRISSGGVTEHA